MSAKRQERTFGSFKIYRAPTRLSALRRGDLDPLRLCDAPLLIKKSLAGAGLVQFKIFDLVDQRRQRLIHIFESLRIVHDLARNQLEADLEQPKRYACSISRTSTSTRRIRTPGTLSG
jgi:hypothetical protein